MGNKKAAARFSGGDEHRRALVDLIGEAGSRWSSHQVFADFVELAALSLSNAVDRAQFDGREAHYLEIVKKYPREQIERFPRMLAHLTLALENCVTLGELDDVLGSVYMALELGSNHAGQFFTPYNLSRMMAMILIGDGAEAREKGFIDVLEPTCGAGGMVIAMADALRHAGLNYQQHLHATCIDIDLRCVHMTYLQATLLHIPAVVLHGNSLTGEIWSRWFTPAHILGGWTAKLKEKRRREPVSMPVDTMCPLPSASGKPSPYSAGAPFGMAEQLPLFEY